MDKHLAREGLASRAKSQLHMNAAIDDLAPGEFAWLDARAVNGNTSIVVDLSDQKAYVMKSGILVGVSTISSGKPGHDTPTGTFEILEKNVEHYSNLYDDAPMPYMQRLTWDGIALHAGRLPGYPASHGCIRLPHEFAAELFAETDIGTTVTVTS
ncbi:L,D-transpeptidase family protein [Sphingomicrobium sp. B8]|uniref:L,D-transpeptidase family protein n=2 Tax=Sphingomicrobium clamense TaxID=2851013 RepID=A0ABS6V4R1_9SPHN|nr:L,D-transpeptidase family protein [Sphingomicrobium sp. B8]